MRFYNQQHKFYCGIDLHARKMYVNVSLTSREKAKKYVEKLTRKHNKGKALGIYTHKLGRAIYFMLKNKKAFDMELFFSH